MKNQIVEKIELMQKNVKNINFNVGDTICINFNITEKGLKNKIQSFEGLVISLKKNGICSTCTIRKMSFGEGVEKTFFIYNNNVCSIKIKKRGLVKKSKIYYIRNLKGKAARIKEKIIKK